MLYRVRKSWDDPKSQTGAYNILSNAINACEEGYNVYDESGRLIYFYPVSLGDTCPYSEPTNVLRYGSHGDGVKWLQWQLVDLGYYCGAAGVDGAYGQNTYKGVESYQIAYNLEVDGICGPQTRKSLAANGKPSKQPEPTPQPTVFFVPRFEIPNKGNPYYNRTVNGGYGTSIEGNPLQAGLTCLANCVGYAAARFNEIIGKNKWVYLNYPPNAEDFIDKAKGEGLEISQTPSLGAIIVWAKGQTHKSEDGAGHVAVVEQINPDGTIITSESGYGSSAFWTTRRRDDGNWGSSSAYRFLGFIKNPSVR